ncbi:MAG: hypothetical protein QF613_02440 [Candidatus Marinimicrobia bacterium]|jgi:MOSC domain-containing protein YiiM|nr:hypothetical protein [Candidatus Neomarinimicrobiota bacterium]MDP6593054.1 hypothetical protein [Candidatus Neomarinimicrobiota bacterium]MDP6836102.1 hypothetical protein [Candidatus Neomarinimicrobiota bacterium]MDP6966278.1 hypothetical protein [Candidatus Neomarinimicrobiota bacterium]|tara:strand:+ start:3906 stop:4490 length:585 start_codon:yes stop_codon:yes gene_type:complete
MKLIERKMGKVTQVLVGKDPDTLEKWPVDSCQITYEGFAGDTHAGLTMKSGGRQPHYPKGTQIRNYRQVSIVSVEELQSIADSMGIDEIQPGWIGANLAVEGIPHLTLLPPSTRMEFADGAVLVVDGENLPCIHPGKIIQQHFPDLKEGAEAFPKHSLGIRGVVAWVERPGTIRTGNEITLRIPHQERWPSNEG